MFTPPFLGKKPTLLLRIRDEAGNGIETRAYLSSKSARSIYHAFGAFGTAAAQIWYSEDFDMINVRASGEDVARWELILHTAEFQKMGTIPLGPIRQDWGYGY